MPNDLESSSLKPGEIKKALKRQIQEIKSDINFCDKLLKAFTLADFLFLLYKKSVPFKVRGFFFCWHSGHFGPLQYVCYSKKIYKSSSQYKGFSESLSQGFEIGEKEDINYWANSLGRPIQNILRLPIYTSQYSRNYPSYIFLEFFTKEPKALLNFYESHLRLIIKCLDRLLWQNHLETGLKLLSSTFDGLNEPLAIFDEKKQLSNKNLAFDSLFYDMENIDSDKLFQDKLFQDKPFQIAGRTFKKHSYPALINDSEYTVCHYADISESLNLKTQMIQNKKMGALGELGESVAHQLNNPLSGVLSMADLLLSQKLKPDFKKDMEDIVEGISRSQEIISNLLDFSRSESYMELYDLNEGLKKTLPLLKSLIHFSDLKVEFFPKPVLVKAQVCLLRQVIFNLIKNAFQAVADLKDLKVIKVRVLAEKEKAFLCVEDSGSGIPPEDYENVFKPFFSTKSGGTGLGLSMSKNIVESFGGKLSLSRSHLGGAFFTMRLPLKNS